MVIVNPYFFVVKMNLFAGMKTKYSFVNRTYLDEANVVKHFFFC